MVCAAAPGLAHVTVKPAQAAAGAEQRYCIRVPTEKSVPTVGLEVEFPADLTVIAIDVPHGWHGATYEDREGRIVGASWEGGEIPPEQALEFGVLARNPAEETFLSWQAIQTYQDASEVHWNGPKEAQFPAALTQVAADASPAPSATGCAEAPSSASTH